MKNEIITTQQYIDNNNQINSTTKYSNKQNQENLKNEFINNFFIQFKQIKETYVQNIEEIYEKVKKINIKEILSYINNLNKEQIDSIINSFISYFTFDEKMFLIKVEENISEMNINEIDNLKIDIIENNDIESKLKKIKLYYRTYILIKDLIEQILTKKNKYLFSNHVLSDENKVKLFHFFSEELIIISNSFYKNCDNFINENDIDNKILGIIYDIFIQLLKDQNPDILSKNQKEQLFENNLKLIIYLENHLLEISLPIILNIINFLNIIYLNYSLDSNEIKEIHNNKFNMECLIKLKQFIFINIKNYKQFNDLKIIINFIAIVILYDFINHNLDENKKKIFNLSYIEYIKESIDKNFNSDENSSINNIFEVIINFLKEPLKKDNYEKIIKLKIMNNDDIILLKNALIKLTEEPNYNNPLTQIQKKKKILINDNEILKNCYTKIKEYFVSIYNEIINYYKNNSQNQYVIFEEEKYNKLIEIIKLLKYFLIIPEEKNLLILIKDNIFNYLISILELNNNEIFLFNDLCREQAFLIFDIITQNENILHKELFIKNNNFINYIIKEFIKYINIFKHFLNDKQKNLNNNIDVFNIIDKIQFKKLSKILCELSREKELLKVNLQIINFNSIYLIFFIDIDDSSIISLYINILKNYLTIIQENNLYSFSNEDNNILASLIINLFNKYNNNASIALELFSLIEIKNNDEYFIKLLINNNFSSIIFSIFSSISQESINDKDKYNSQCIFPALNTIYNLLKYNFFIVELLNIGINNVIICLNQYIFNSKICEIFLLIILKIIENENNIKMLINRINLADVKNLVVNILEKYLSTCHKNLIEFSLKVIEFFIESPNNLINFSKSNDKNNSILMSSLFQCINQNYSDSNIVNLAIKILFRYISYVKINKEKSRIILDNNLDEEDEDDDLPDDLFSEEYPQVLKIFKCKYFLEFIGNYLVKLFDIYLIKEKNSEIIKNIIEIIRILINIIDCIENLKKLFSAIIEVLFKFLNIFLKYDENIRQNNTESILDLINHFTFFSYKIISIKKETIHDNVIIIISLISIVINNFKIKLELIERFLQILYDTCLYGNKAQLIKSFNIIKKIFDKLRELYELMIIKDEKKEYFIFLFTKILKELSKYELEILNNNLLFILKNIPIRNIKGLNKIYDNNNSEKDYSEFKDKLLRMCCIYFIESNEEAIIVLNIIKNLYNQYTSLSTDINKTNYEIRFILCLIFDLCIKTPFLKVEIIKDNQSILSQIKIYINNLSKEDPNLKLAYDKCFNEMKNEKNYSFKLKEINNMKYKTRNILLIDKINNEDKFNKMKLFLLVENFVYLYTNKDCIKGKLFMDENLRIININSNDNKLIDSVQINFISKIVNDSSNKDFISKGFFSHKIKSSNCFSIYSNNNEEEKVFNIECLNEEISSKYVKYFNFLIDFDKSINLFK